MPEKTLVSTIGAHFRLQPQHPVQRHKVNGRWVDISYGEMGKIVREIAAGLLALGLQKGERVSLLSQNRVEWAHCDLGVLFAGGLTVTIYPNSIRREVAYILENSESQFVFVEDPGQLEKVREARGGLPQLKKAVLISGQTPPDDFVLALDALRELGRNRLDRQPDQLEEIAADIHPDEVMAIIYTSGTTGPPKGVMLTHHNILYVIETILDTLGDAASLQLTLSFLPLSHALERVGGHFTPLTQGRTIAYAENLDKVGENFRDVSPDMACAVPRVFEKVYARINEQLKQAPPMRQKIFSWALGVGKQALPYRQQNRPLPFGLALKHRLADRLVFGKLRAVLGGRLKYFISGGAPLSAQIAEFFFTAGVVVLEGWGATETAAPSTMNMPDAFKIGSVGRPLKGVEVRVESDGELLIRGPNVCQGYWRMPEQSAETFDAQGWYHTGDIGRIDEEGYVYITDRKKELIITAAGKNISPQNIENKLKLSPLISNAMAVGDNRRYVSALITLEPGAVCRQLRLADLPPIVLADREDVRQLIQAEVNKVNTDLPRFEQIKKFRLLPADFTVEADELSPSLKLKRKHINARYRDLIEAMYNEPAREIID